MHKHICAPIHIRTQTYTQNKIKSHCQVEDLTQCPQYEVASIIKPLLSTTKRLIFAIT